MNRTYIIADIGACHDGSLARMQDAISAPAVGGIVRLVGIRPTDTPVRELDRATGADPDALAGDLGERWHNVAVIRPGGVWEHKGVEYDAVVVDATGLSPAEVYLAASRAAHELVVVR